MIRLKSLLSEQFLDQSPTTNWQSDRTSSRRTSISTNPTELVTNQQIKKVKDFIKNTGNKLLAKVDGSTIIKDRYTYKVGKIIGVDAGYFNLDYKIILNSMRLTDYKSASISISVEASVPDGLLKGSTAKLNTTVTFTTSISPGKSDGKGNTVFYLSPADINLSTSFIGLGENIDLPWYIDTLIVAALGPTFAFTAYTISFAIRDNWLVVNDSFTNNHKLKQIDITSEIANYFEGIPITIPTSYLTPPIGMGSKDTILKAIGAA